MRDAVNNVTPTQHQDRLIDVELAVQQRALFPVARALGVHEVHYAMVVIFAMGLGLFAPPFGVGFYAACAIGKVDPDKAFSRVWPHLGALFIALLVIAAIPWISIGFL